MQLIRNVLEPRRLLLAWQSPQPGSSRRRWAVGELVRESTAPEAPAILRYFDDAEMAGALREGFAGYPAFSPTRRVHDKGVIETFMRRLPPRRRPDFRRYLESLFIDPDAEFSDFALLGASEAKLPSDGFSLVNPLDAVEAPARFLAEAAGYRHLPERPVPRFGQEVTFRPEPENPHDPNAIRIYAGPSALGWVNRLQTAAFHRWIAGGQVSARVARVDGAPEHPRLHLLVSVD